MQIKELKVRPRRAAREGPCGPLLASMLGCFSTYNDVHGMGPCQDAVKSLFECVKTTNKNKAKPRSSINYHLMRLNKYLK
ncbi:uncharacterized protein C8Q71DRAFT_735121 [Rhodofomes roseus]|uniref:CHCH domain-containing protein n=1 Tax=Rhodofomes roseus TaxID=34475 RepID=A0ABQ8KVN0_9APHY|nr:uncharacterized protein C8Q71DRAFT_735121 [Rhodofomes roseus]KAH9842907.1 hypothetical protein C8Q71DRAFT_735121 [Rhodofomes roseus]